MEPKEVKVSINEFDLKIIEKALLFLRANLDDYNDMNEDSPALTESQVTKVYEGMF